MSWTYRTDGFIRVQRRPRPCAATAEAVLGRFQSEAGTGRWAAGFVAHRVYRRRMVPVALAGWVDALGGGGARLGHAFACTCVLMTLSWLHASRRALRPHDRAASRLFSSGLRPVAARAGLAQRLNAPVAQRGWRLQLLTA